MPASEKQIAANRANAKKCTGPRTPEGKERSKMNALSHGLTAQTGVLPGEDEQELMDLAESLTRQLKPEGIVQRLIAERIVSLAWKLRRVARAEEVVAEEMEKAALKRWKKGNDLAEESPIFRKFVGEEPDDRDGSQLLAAALEHQQDGRLVRITEYELKIDGALRGAIRELRQLKKDLRAADALEVDPESAEPIENLVGKTKPIAAQDDSPQETAATQLTAESSSPAPQTSSSPPPAPRP